MCSLLSICTSDITVLLAGLKIDDVLLPATWKSINDS